MRRFPFKLCLLSFPTWSPGQTACWPSPSRTKQVDCQRGKVRKPKLGTESAHVGRTHTGRWTCCKDEFWKHSQAGKWWSPKDVGTQGSLTMSQHLCLTLDFLGGWSSALSIQKEGVCPSTASQPFVVVLPFTSIVTHWVHPPGPLEMHTPTPLSTKSCPGKMNYISYTSNLNRMWNLRSSLVIGKFHILILRGSREPGWPVAEGKDLDTQSTEHSSSHWINSCWSLVSWISTHHLKGRALYAWVGKPGDRKHKAFQGLPETTPITTKGNSHRVKSIMPNGVGH